MVTPLSLAFSNLDYPGYFIVFFRLTLLVLRSQNIWLYLNDLLTIWNAEKKRKSNVVSNKPTDNSDASNYGLHYRDTYDHFS